MMRLDDSSREAGLLNPGTQYSSLEMQMSEFDVPMSTSRGPGKSRSRCWAVGACIAFVVVVGVVSGSVAGASRSAPGGPREAELRKQHAHFAPAPSPEGGAGEAPPAPPLGGFTEPITSPPAEAPPSPPSLGPAGAPGPSANRFHQMHYQTICQQTIDPAACLDLFAGNANSNKVDLQQWTIMTMEAADNALNQSYTLAVDLRGSNPQNPALEQCIDVFGMAMDEVEGSMYAVAEIDEHNPGPAATDVSIALAAAMTYYDTCQQGIDDAGSFKGAETILSTRVDTLLSIALTFVNKLALGDGNHHRRLLSVDRLFSGRRLL